MTTIPFLKNLKKLRQTVVIYSTDRKTLIHCPKNYNGEFEIPEGVETIGIEAFAGCKKLTAAILPATLKEIKMLAFANCPELRKISIQSYKPIDIADDAFEKLHFEKCELSTNSANIQTDILKQFRFTERKNQKTTPVISASKQVI